AGPPAAPQTGVANDGDAGPSATRRVLVVDDVRDAADGLAAVLRAWGHEARAAYDGPAALAAARDFRPDTVLLDLGVGGMAASASPPRPPPAPKTASVTLVALTGSGQESDRRRTRDAGFARHLVKPVELEELQHLLATLKA